VFRTQLILLSLPAQFRNAHTRLADGLLRNVNGVLNSIPILGPIVGTIIDLVFGLLAVSSLHPWDPDKNLLKPDA
jgi:hypothetical protein